jgi:hypothetical protein
MCLEIDGGKETWRKKSVHRLALAFLRVGNFLTGRCPGGGAACDDGVPIVKMALPLLLGVCT